VPTVKQVNGIKKCKLKGNVTKNVEKRLKSLKKPASKKI